MLKQAVAVGCVKAQVFMRAGKFKLHCDNGIDPIPLFAAHDPDAMKNAEAAMEDRRQALIVKADARDMSLNEIQESIAILLKEGKIK